MGKMSYMLSIVLFVDILFLTFWGGSSSLQSLLISWISNPSSFDGNLFTIALQSLGTTILAAGIGAAVVTAFSGGRSDTVLFSGFAFGILFNIGLDYLAMYNAVAQINQTIALIFIFPFMFMFAWMVVEWLAKKD